MYIVYVPLSHTKDFKMALTASLCDALHEKSLRKENYASVCCTVALDYAADSSVPNANIELRLKRNRKGDQLLDCVYCVVEIIIINHLLVIFCSRSF